MLDNSSNKKSTQELTEQGFLRIWNLLLKDENSSQNALRAAIVKLISTKTDSDFAAAVRTLADTALDYCSTYLEVKVPPGGSNLFKPFASQVKWLESYLKKSRKRSKNSKKLRK